MSESYNDELFKRLLATYTAYCCQYAKKGITGVIPLLAFSYEDYPSAGLTRQIKYGDKWYRAMHVFLGDDVKDFAIDHCSYEADGEHSLVPWLQLAMNAISSDYKVFTYVQSHSAPLGAFTKRAIERYHEMATALGISNDEEVVDSNKKFFVCVVGLIHKKKIDELYKDPPPSILHIFPAKVMPSIPRPNTVKTYVLKSDVLEDSASNAIEKELVFEVPE